MNYNIIYQKLISRALNRKLTTYSESHHIIPRCMGGADDASNLVDLTPEEHFVCHQLLVKMHPNNASLVYAARMMTVSAPNTDRSKNKLFGWLRRKNLEAQQNKIFSDETRKKMSESAKLKPRVECPHCGKTGLVGNMNRWHFDNCSKGPNKVVHTIPEKQKQKISVGLKQAKHEILNCEFCGLEGKKCVISTHQQFCKSNPNRKKKVDPKIQCPHCNVVGTPANMKRWHFDNCKMKPQ